MISFLKDILQKREEQMNDPISFSKCVISAYMSGFTIDGKRKIFSRRAIITGPKIFQIERWLEENVTEDYHVFHGYSGTHIYFNSDSLGMILKITWNF